MINDIENPFSVTKATEFTDTEINEYWVDFNSEKNESIISILNPSEYLPKYVIGGKGCGKTHILRYFSYPLQKIRYCNDIAAALKNDKYIGLYSVLHGINSSRFTGKGISEDEWASIFEYYFELYICNGLLQTILEINSLIGLAEEVEGNIVDSILKLFNNYDSIEKVRNFKGLQDLLKGFRRKIDAQVSNSAFLRKLDYNEVKISFSPGDLIFGIPAIVVKSHDIYKDVKFIYIFDEYEKLYEWQKRFVNTLVWDKKTPVTFWIGARRYGYTTRETKSLESMIPGSEYQEVNLDFIIRSNEDIYIQFAKKLYLNRLKKYYDSKKLNLSIDQIEKSFISNFEEYDEEKIIAQIKAKNKNKEYKHIKDLKRKISEGIKSNQALGLSDQDATTPLVDKLIGDTDNPLMQKYKIFAFYQLWYQEKGDFFYIVDFINEEFLKLRNNEKSIFDEIKDKRKKDLIAQLTKENNIKNTEYSGINTFIDLSQGNARTFILILKKIIEFARIRGERPLEQGGLISLDTQYLAVFDTGRWFYEDAELIGDSGKQMYYSLKCLTDYFMLQRFCDKPTETTVSCFYVKSEELSSITIACIELMKMHSILLEDEDGRLEKNSGRKERLFKLNKILAPLWNLPTVIRGSIYLNMEVAESIFDFNQSKNFNRLYKERINELNAPMFIKQKHKVGKPKNKNSSNTLF